MRDDHGLRALDFGDETVMKWESMALKPVAIKIEEIHVPVDRRKDIDPEADDAAAENIMTPKTAPSRCAKARGATSWSKASTAWKPTRRWAKIRSRRTSSPPSGIEGRGDPEAPTASPPTPPNRGAAPLRFQS